MNYNLIMWIGLAFYIAIFFTFIVYQMHDRKKDREQWLSDQLTPSFNKVLYFIVSPLDKRKMEKKKGER